MIEEGALVILKDGDIDVSVVAGLAAKQGVQGPAAAQAPHGTEGRHEVGDASNGFWDVVRRLAGDRGSQKMLFAVGQP